MWGMGAFFTFAMPLCGGIVFGWASIRTRGALPIGLHLGGNWIQASVLSFRPASDAAAPSVLWTAYLTETQHRALYAPDLVAHLPYLATLVVAALPLRFVLTRVELDAPA
jgi:hypothetical protein